jgi:hypothetical protein
VVGGDEDALQKVINRLAAGSRFRRPLEGVQPAAVAAEEKEIAEFEEGNQRARDLRLKAQEKRAQDRKNDALWQRAENERWAAATQQQDHEAAEAKRKAAEEKRQARQVIQQQINRGSELLQEQQEDRQWGFKVASGLATQNDMLARQNQLEKRQWQHFAQALQENNVGAPVN